MTQIYNKKYKQQHIVFIIIVISALLAINLWLYFKPSKLELDIALWLQFGHPAWLNPYVIHITNSYIFTAMLAGIVCLAGLVFKKYATSAMLALSLISLLLIDPLKLLFQRPRPEMEIPIIELVSGTSFPSGHAYTATILAGSLYLAYTVGFNGDKRIGISLAILYVLLMSWSRVYLSVHYPSDVAGGILFGLTLMLAISWIYKWLGKMQLKIGMQPTK